MAGDPLGVVLPELDLVDLRDLHVIVRRIAATEESRRRARLWTAVAMRMRDELARRADVELDFADALDDTVGELVPDPLQAIDDAPGGAAT